MERPTNYSAQTDPSTGLGLDLEQVLLQVWANDPNQLKQLAHFRKPSVLFNEKELRDAAHAEVANSAQEMEKASRKRKPLNPEEKAKQSRDRNREHAKNTRLRKKAYILKLKQLVDEMNKQKELEDLERTSFAEKFYSQYLERKNAVLLFLTFRARNDQDRRKWESIFDEDVVLKLPITPYRFFLKSEIQGSQRHVQGIDGILADSKSLAIMIESIGIGSPGWKEVMIRGESCCKLVYHTSKDDTICGSDIVMCRFIMRVEGHELFGSTYSCTQAGMLCCKFNDVGKIISIEIMFDVMSFMQQLQRTAGLMPEHSVVPNTLEMALQPSNEIRLLVKSGSPSTCVHVNLQFTRFSGFSQGDIENCDVTHVLNLSETDKTSFEKLLVQCSDGAGPASAVLTILNLRTTRGSFSAKCYVKVLPLSSDTERISHLLLVITDLSTSSNEREKES